MVWIFSVREIGLPFAHSPDFEVNWQSRWFKILLIKQETSIISFDKCSSLGKVIITKGSFNVISKILTSNKAGVAGLTNASHVL